MKITFGNGIAFSYAVSAFAAQKMLGVPVPENSYMHLHGAGKAFKEWLSLLNLSDLGQLILPLGIIK